ETPAAPAAVTLSTEAELLENARQAPCDNRERLGAVRMIFEAVGADPNAIHTDRFKRVENLRLEIPGRTADTIVVGAHWDKVRLGCGAVDNWTGIVTLIHLFRTLQTVPTEKTVVFVAFGREEEGLVGSQAMVKDVPREERQRYCAMVNLDSLGLTKPQVGRNLSSKKLSQAAAELAERMNIPFGEGIVAGNADSTAFLDRGIPALTLHGLPRDYRSILHTDKDTIELIDSHSLYLGYRLALGLVAEIDRAPCEAWR
ncbi:MAG: M20/M25/M40 family metallo-hydrolase, partial [Acidobacteria bacterium]|nr:M20/M25/M40 family metallo-hydrolase [Acidobacteriota bacterium]